MSETKFKVGDKVSEPCDAYIERNDRIWVVKAILTVTKAGRRVTTSDGREWYTPSYSDTWRGYGKHSGHGLRAYQPGDDAADALASAGYYKHEAEAHRLAAGVADAAASRWDVDAARAHNEADRLEEQAEGLEAQS